MRVGGAQQDAAGDAAQNGDAVNQSLGAGDLLLVDGAVADGVDGDARGEDRRPHRQQPGRRRERDAEDVPHPQEATGCHHQAEDEADPGDVDDPVPALEVADATDVDGDFRGE